MEVGSAGARILRRGAVFLSFFLEKNVWRAD
jgi:hypothetical protein